MIPTVPPERSTLHTPRLALEPAEPRHAEGLWRAAESSLPELRPWLFWAVDSDLAGTLAWTRTSERAWKAGSDWVFAVVSAGEVIGSIGLHHHDRILEAAELGYWLSSEATGRGLMTEAAGAVVDFGFERLTLHRLELRAAPDNHASIRVAEKVGFRREGLLRHGSRGAGGWHDVYLFGLLAGDRRTRPAS